MSGFEVAGVVLALLPLAVKAARTYADILSAHKTARFELKKLIQDLETEEACLRNTCELLLAEVAPRHAVDKLVGTPFGPEWARFNKQIRLRLWHTHDCFSENINEMLEATKDLHDKLGVLADGAPSFADPVAIVRELKKKSAFTIRKKDYDTVLNRIKAANLVLERLVSQSRQLEPDRKHRSQARVTRLIRELARGLYSALRRVSGCACVSTSQVHYAHNACLELRPRSEVVLLPDDTDDDAAKTLDFHILVVSNDAPASVQLDINTPSRLDSIEVRIIAQQLEDAPITPPGSCTMPTNLSPQPIHPKQTQIAVSKTTRWPRVVRFKTEREPALTVLSETTLNRSFQSIDMTEKPKQMTSRAISSLCQSVLEQRQTTAIQCYGYIADDLEGRRFELYPGTIQPRSDISHPRVITLRQILSDGWQSSQPLSFLDKLEVSLALSVGVLHLYKTPWLGHIVTLDDIVFVSDGTKDRPHSCRPFISRTLLTVQASDANKADFYVANLAILSLGVMLIQVMIGKTVEALVLTEDMDASAVVAKCAVGTELLGQVRGCGGTNYEAAVSWCLENVLKVANLKNDKFCNEYYAEVVARLQEDLQLLSDD